MNMAGLGGWRGLSRALKCFGVRGFLRRVRQDHKVARCMAHNLARARKSESIRARIWYPGGYPGIPEDTRIREPILGQILARISACKMKGLASIARSWPQLQLSQIKLLPPLITLQPLV